MAAARRGALLPFDKLLVVADEGLVAQVIAATLPFETVIGGRYRVSVTRAEVHFEDGFGLVRLDGEASFADRPASDGHAERDRLRRARRRRPGSRTRACCAAA